MEKKKMTGDMDERFKREEARFRHAGYVIFFGLAALVFLPIIAGVISGLSGDRVWDPFTGEPAIAERQMDCKREAADLIYLAGKEDARAALWEQRYRRWVVRCQDENHEVYDLLSLTRRRVQGSEEAPTLDSEPVPD